MHASRSAEIELKLLIPGLTPAQARQALGRTPTLRRREPQVLKLWNIYYDTPDQFLRSQRSALRLRRTTRLGTGMPRTPWLQTFKTAGHSQGGLSQRGEWENPVRGRALSLAALADSPWPVLDPDGTRFAALRPCFETSCERTLWLVRKRNGAVMEVALDAGEIRAGANAGPGARPTEQPIKQPMTQPMLELELELLQGSPQDLFELAAELARHLPLLPFDTSKAQRGYALFDAVTAPASTTALRARTLALPRQMPPTTAACLVLGEILQQLTGNVALLAEQLCTPPGSEPRQRGIPAPELVHQTRVGWRRWRSLLRLLRPWLPPSDVLSTARGPLEPLLEALAQCRNLDVAHTETLPHWASAYTHSALFANTSESADQPDSAVVAWQQDVEDALQRLEGARHQAYKALAQTLQDPATGASLLAHAQWLQAVEATDKPAKTHANTPDHTPAANTKTAAPRRKKSPWAEARLQRWHRRLQRWLKASQRPGAHPQQLHNARLLAKRLRYGCEALASLLPKQARGWTSDATGWQTRIGLQRDAHQAAQLLLAVGAPPALAAFLRGVASATDIGAPLKRSL
jgi:inorganic triphosphatase YgiF